MFQTADTSVEVGNAFPKLSRIADFITGTNEQDWVAQWLLENKNLVDSK